MEMLETPPDAPKPYTFLKVLFETRLGSYRTYSEALGTTHSHLRASAVYSVLTDVMRGCRAALHPVPTCPLDPTQLARSALGPAGTSRLPPREHSLALPQDIPLPSVCAVARYVHAGPWERLPLRFDRGRDPDPLGCRQCTPASDSITSRPAHRVLHPSVPSASAHGHGCPP